MMSAAFASHALDLVDLTVWAAVRIAVNLPAYDLQDPRLPRYLSELLDLYGVPAQELSLEITETAFLMPRSCAAPPWPTAIGRSCPRRSTSGIDSGSLVWPKASKMNGR